MLGIEVESGGGVTRNSGSSPGVVATRGGGEDVKGKGEWFLSTTKGSLSV